MKKILFIIPFLFLFIINTYSQILDGVPSDSTTISFSIDTLSNSDILIDTSATNNWQLGNTHKPFFASNGNSIHAIMTDTAGPYPINMDNSFMLKFNHVYLNIIIDFWHRYQTDSSHDGGLVEVSNDSINWKNVTGTCNTDGTFLPGFKTYNFYAPDDTLVSGEAAFSGTSNGSQYSRFQIFMYIPEKLTDNTCNFSNNNPVWIRFRFISDSVADNMDGWLIDSIKIESDNYGSSVKTVKKSNLDIYPNPSFDGLYNFPKLTGKENYHIDIYNMLGVNLIELPYTHVVDMGKYPEGNYLYRVSDGINYYSGQLIKR